MSIMVKRRKLLSASLILALFLTLLIPVSAAYQEYRYAYSGATEAIGSLYAYQYDDYVRIGGATTYVSGGSGRVSAYAYMYTNNSSLGPYESGETAGSLASGVSAQTGRQVFSADQVTSISCSHHVVLPNGSVLTPEGQSYTCS